MEQVFWFFNENEGYYSDQCIKALAEGRIQEVPSITEWNAEEDYHEKWHYEEGEPYTREPYSVALESVTRPYVVISVRDWENLVYNANAQQMQIVNNPETNLPMLAPLPEPTKVEQLEQEMAQCKQYLADTDYMATKCYELGLNMAQEYPTEQKKRAEARRRINEIEAELATTGETV